MSRLFILLFLVFSVSWVFSEDKPATETKEPEKKGLELDFSKFIFTTNKGTAVKTSKLTCGVIRKMNKGERYIQGYTTSKKPIYAQKWHRESAVWEKDVPVIEGYIFGAVIVFETFSEEEKIVIEMVDTPPNEFELNGVKSKQVKKSFELKKGAKNYHLVTTFIKEEASLMQFGLWKKDFYNNGKLIFSYTFNLVKPSEEELKLNAVYEDYVKEAEASQQPPAEEPKKK